MRVHQSFLVNMRYIVQISSYCLQLQQGITLPVPKKRYPYVKSEYAIFLGGSRWKKAFGFTGAAILLMANTILLQGAFWPKIILVFFIGYLYIVAFYQAKAADILGSITFYYSIIAGMYFIIVLIFLCSRTLSKNGWLLYGMAFFAKCLELGIGLLIRRIWRKGNRERTISKEIRRLMFFSGILILIGAFITEFLNKNEAVPEDILILMIGIICLSDFSLLYLLLAARAEMERDSLRDIAAQTRMQLEIYKNKQELYTKQGKRSHEHKKQLLTIGHMLEQGQTAQALKYTRSLTGSMAKELDSIYTNHPIAERYDGSFIVRQKDGYVKVAVVIPNP